MKRMTLQEFEGAIEAQGRKRQDVVFICPVCKTHQSAQDLVDAGIKKEDVGRFVGFSCVGRWNKKKGCDWTLGGLFQMHELEVTGADGKAHPHFMPADPKEL